MPRYIDADALKLDIDLSKGATVLDMAISIIKAVKEAPTADVVPKREVDWNSIPVDVSEALKQRAVEKAKTEVAREIFEEIEGLFFKNGVFVHVHSYNELKKKYTEEAKKDCGEG